MYEKVNDYDESVWLLFELKYKISDIGSSKAFVNSENNFTLQSITGKLEIFFIKSYVISVLTKFNFMSC